uniref:Uncharacterized protein n=1 Tax=Brassica oleracea var. oleracea TaxID=109376 RepID=A0A0D3BTH9_BRAOL
MVAPGSNGSSYISRDNFESDPKGYFDNLHSSGQGSNSAGGWGFELGWRILERGGVPRALTGTGAGWRRA